MIKKKNLSYRNPCRTGGTHSENQRNERRFARELREIWNMRMTVILIVICAFGKVPNGFIRWFEESEIGGRAETIQNTSLLRLN